MASESRVLGSALVHDSEYREHFTGEGHPERPERYTAVIEGLASDGLLERTLNLAPRPAELEEIAACHSPAIFSWRSKKSRPARAP
jgi:acetoin utilization deacetylase AcuC-like enzyme